MPLFWTLTLVYLDSEKSYTDRSLLSITIQVHRCALSPSRPSLHTLIHNTHIAFPHIPAIMLPLRICPYYAHTATSLGWLDGFSDLIRGSSSHPPLPPSSSSLYIDWVFCCQLPCSRIVPTRRLYPCLFPVYPVQCIAFPSFLLCMCNVRAMLCAAKGICLSESENVLKLLQASLKMQELGRTSIIPCTKRRVKFFSFQIVYSSLQDQCYDQENLRTPSCRKRVLENQNRKR